MGFKKIIACLDVKNGKTTKGVKFLNNIELGDPLEMAVDYAKQGADEIVLYDITASLEGRTATFELVKNIASGINVPLTVGGGISTLSHIEDILKLGAVKVSLNSSVVKNPEFLKDASRNFGNEVIAVGVDTQRSSKMACGYEVMTAGGRAAAGIDLLDWVKRMEEYGAGELIINSVDGDGTKSGYDIPQLIAVKSAVTVPVVASGGAGELDHIYEVFFKADVESALVASMLHYGTCTVEGIKGYLKAKNIPVRTE